MRMKVNQHIKHSHDYVCYVMLYQKKIDVSIPDVTLGINTFVIRNW